MQWKQKPPMGRPLIPKHPHLDGLVGWWLFQEGGGDQAYDLSGNANTGTLNNFDFPATTSSGWNPGKFGRTLLYDGAGDYINSGFTYNFGDITSKGYSISVWIKSTGLSADYQEIVVSTSEAGAFDPHFALAFDNNAGGVTGVNSRLYFRQRGNGGAGISFVDSPTIIENDNIWHHIVSVSDGDGNLLLYLDGAKTTAVSVAAGDMDVTEPFYIGTGNARGADDANYFTGLIDDLRIFNRGLTDAEALDLFIDPFGAFQIWSLAMILPPVAAPVVIYYPALTYPEVPGFPTGHEDVPTGPDLYTAVASYIEDMTADAALLFDNIGNIELGATEGIAWDSVIRIDLSGGEIKFTALSVNTELIVDTPTLTTLNVTGDLVVSNDLIIDGDIAVIGAVSQDYVDRGIQTMTQVTEPGDPADNNAVFWISDGTGYGDAGDFCCKITEGGGTTDFTISDYSAL